MSENQPERPWESSPDKPTAKAKEPTPAWSYAVMGLLIVAVLLGISMCSGSDSGDDTADLGWSAENACEGFVENRLKSPGSAEFDSNATNSGEEWTVTGTVDSENSYGASVRNDFTCVVHRDADRWVLVSLTGLTN